MPYALPAFNLDIGIWEGPWATKTLRIETVGNLAVGKRGQQIWPYWSLTGSAYQGIVPLLLLPPLTDIRDSSCGPTLDYVEVPAGSDRWYQVSGVEDIGKGFDNEHRAAYITKVYEGVDGSTYNGYFWPTPIP